MNTEKKSSYDGVHEALSKLLEKNLTKYMDKPLNLLTCTQIYQTIFDSLTHIFNESNIKLANESMNYIAQEYYDAVSINEREELDSNIFTQRAKVENIETKELALLATMFRKTWIAIPVITEIRKRS